MLGATAYVTPLHAPLFLQHVISDCVQHFCQWSNAFMFYLTNFMYNPCDKLAEDNLRYATASNIKVEPLPFTPS